MTDYPTKLSYIPFSQLVITSLVIMDIYLEEKEYPKNNIKIHIEIRNRPPDHYQGFKIVIIPLYANREVVMSEKFSLNFNKVIQLLLLCEASKLIEIGIKSP